MRVSSASHSTYRCYPNFCLRVLMYLLVVFCYFMGLQGAIFATVALLLIDWVRHRRVDDLPCRSRFLFSWRSSVTHTQTRTHTHTTHTHTHTHTHAHTTAAWYCCLSVVCTSNVRRRKRIFIQFSAPFQPGNNQNSAPN